MLNRHRRAGILKATVVIATLLCCRTGTCDPCALLSPVERSSLRCYDYIYEVTRSARGGQIEGSMTFAGTVYREADRIMVLEELLGASGETMGYAKLWTAEEFCSGTGHSALECRPLTLGGSVEQEVFELYLVEELINGRSSLAPFRALCEANPASPPEVDGEWLQTDHRNPGGAAILSRREGVGSQRGHHSVAVYTAEGAKVYQMELKASQTGEVEFAEFSRYYLDTGELRHRAVAELTPVREECALLTGGLTVDELIARMLRKDTQFTHTTLDHLGNRQTRVHQDGRWHTPEGLLRIAETANPSTTPTTDQILGSDDGYGRTERRMGKWAIAAGLVLIALGALKFVYTALRR